MDYDLYVKFLEGENKRLQEGIEQSVSREREFLKYRTESFLAVSASHKRQVEYLERDIETYKEILESYKRMHKMQEKTIKTMDSTIKLVRSSRDMSENATRVFAGISGLLLAVLLVSTFWGSF